MAELPIWSFSNGSSISFKLASRRTRRSALYKRGALTVGSHLVDSSAKARQRTQDIRVDFSRVGLTSDRVSVREAEQLRDPLVQRLDLLRSSAYRTARSSRPVEAELTLSWSPSKRARKEA